MAAKKASPAMDFIVKSLEQNTGASYKEISEAAAEKGLVVYPVMYGRAKLKLGLVSTGNAKASGRVAAGSVATGRAAAGKKAKRKAAKKPAEMTSPGKALAQAARSQAASSRAAGREARGSSARRGPGRPRKVAKTASPKSAGSAATSIDGIVAAVKSSAEARARYQTALQRISSILEGVLDD